MEFTLKPYFAHARWFAGIILFIEQRPEVVSNE